MLNLSYEDSRMRVNVHIETQDGPTWESLTTDWAMFLRAIGYVVDGGEVENAVKGVLSDLAKAEGVPF